MRRRLLASEALSGSSAVPRRRLLAREALGGSSEVRLDSPPDTGTPAKRSVGCPAADSRSVGVALLQTVVLLQPVDLSACLLSCSPLSVSGASGCRSPPVAPGPAEAGPSVGCPAAESGPAAETESEAAALGPGAPSPTGAATGRAVAVGSSCSAEATTVSGPRPVAVRGAAFGDVVPVAAMPLVRSLPVPVGFDEGRNQCAPAPKPDELGLTCRTKDVAEEPHPEAEAPVVPPVESEAERDVLDDAEPEDPAAPAAAPERFPLVLDAEPLRRGKDPPAPGLTPEPDHTASASGVSSASDRRGPRPPPPRPFCRADCSVATQSGDAAGLSGAVVGLAPTRAAAACAWAGHGGAAVACGPATGPTGPAAPPAGLSVTSVSVLAAATEFLSDDRD